MQPTAQMQSWYERGSRDAERYRSLTAAYYEMADRDLDVVAPNPILSACYESGFRGQAMLIWVEAWRYGNIPECGYSRNHRDQCPEAGVSVMGLGEPGEADDTDGTFSPFNDGRPMVRVAGWLIHKRGSDGEPLLVGAEEME